MIKKKKKIPAQFSDSNCPQYLTQKREELVSVRARARTTYLIIEEDARDSIGNDKYALLSKTSNLLISLVFFCSSRGFAASMRRNRHKNSKPKRANLHHE